MTYAQVVLGPPGSGKTTYCKGMQEFLQSSGRDTIIVNMDPANESLPYTPTIDISELVSLENVMEELVLGPNGGLVYCMEYIEQNFDWLKMKLSDAIKQGKYILFDFPGQVELYTHGTSVNNILKELQNLGIKLVVVHLVDAHHCTDSAKFISVVLLSLSSMVRLEFPHVNVLSKVDLMQQYGSLAFNLDYYTDVLDLRYLLDRLDAPSLPITNSNDYDDDIMSMDIEYEAIKETPLKRKFKKLNAALIDVIEDFSLVSFHPLMIEDQESVDKLVKWIDKAGGYVFTSRDFQLGQVIARDLSHERQSITKDLSEKYLEGQ